jgi:DNA repair photolyase
VGEIGDAKRDIRERFLDLPEGPVGVLDPISQLLHRRHGRFSRLFGPTQPSHFFRTFIELIPQLLDLRRRRPPFLAQFLDISPGDVVPASSESSADVIEVVAEKFEIVHGLLFENAWNLAPELRRVNETGRRTMTLQPVQTLTSIGHEGEDRSMRQISNPPNPFESQHRDLLEPAGTAELTLYADDSREILSRNDSPDLPFRWSVNPYRGCFHACAYCYARPSHEYWGFGAGTDFESKIVVKEDAPRLLRRAFEKPSWQGELIVFSGNTDCYQPLESEYGLTRACLEVCADYRNPVCIITKGALILRDLDVLGRLHGEASVVVYFSIPFSSEDVARKVEPHVPSIAKRFSAMKALSDAGIPTGLSIAPVIPGLNEDDIPELLDRAYGAGARTATYSLLRLSGSLETVFLERMSEAFPDRLGKITNRLREIRGGALTESRFFKRQQGQGPYWKLIEQLFELAKRKVGFPEDGMSAIPRTFRRSGLEQPSLF